MKIKGTAYHLLKKGVKISASDLYIFPIDCNQYELSFRYHDQIISERKISIEEAEKLILFFKYLGGMDVSERRKVQVGSATIKRKEWQTRFRLSTVADYRNRETLVLRFLYQTKGSTGLTFCLPEQWDLLKRTIQDKGLYLFSGPTGAGKTTTMYCLAKYLLEKKRRQIITIEDPVEIEDAQFLQFQVNEKIGLTYESLSKVCLRHRPDVLIVGEIRDQETAQIVMRAALTGHLVFSTIHARSKNQIEERLFDLGVTRDEFSQSVSGLIYQEILPLTTAANDYGVLYDLTLQKREVSTWQKSLETAYQTKIISQSTYQNFSQTNT